MHHSWTKASLFPPSVQQSGWHELTLGTAQEQFIMGVTDKKKHTHRAELSMAMAGRLNSEALFLRAGTQSVGRYVTTRAPSPGRSCERPHPNTGEVAAAAAAAADSPLGSC